MSKLTRKDWRNDYPADVDKWLAIYAQDKNLFWFSDSGHIQPVIDELILRLEQADKRAEERIIKQLKKMIAGYGRVGWTIEQNALQLAIDELEKDNK